MSYHAVGALAVAAQPVAIQSGAVRFMGGVKTKTLRAQMNMKIIRVEYISSNKTYNIRYRRGLAMHTISFMTRVDVRPGQLVSAGQVLGQQDIALFDVNVTNRKAVKRRLPTPAEEASIPLAKFASKGLWTYRFDWISDKLVMYKHADLREIVYNKVTRFKTANARKFYDRWKGAIQGRFVKYNRPGTWDEETARLGRNLRNVTIRNARSRPLVTATPWVSTEIYFGTKPFETFKDQKGKRWGFFYNAATDTLIIKRHTPPVSLWSKIGKVIKKAIGWLWEKVKDLFKTLCKFLTQGSSAEAVEAAKALAISSGDPYAMGAGAAVEIAQTICGVTRPPQDPGFGPGAVVGMPWWTLPALIGAGGLGYYLVTRK